jgi:hypothetical protein
MGSGTTTVLATPAIVDIRNSADPSSIAAFRMSRVATSNGFHCQREPAIRIFARYQSVYAPCIGHYEVDG